MNDLWHSLSPPKSYFRIPISHNFKRTALTVFGSPRQGCPNDVDYEIVGVVGDTLYQVGKEPMATMYFPILEGDPKRRDARGPHGIGSLTILRSGAKADCFTRSGASCFRCPDHGSDDRRVAGRCQSDCEPSSCLCDSVAASCLGGIVRCAVVHNHSADNGTGNPNGAPRNETSFYD